MTKPLFKIDLIPLDSKKLPLLIPIALFTGGILIAFQWKCGNEIFLNGLISIFIFLVFFKNYIHVRQILCVGFLCAGILYGSASQYLEPNHIARFSNTEQTVIKGEVASLPEDKWVGEKQTTSFILEAHELKINKKWQKVQGKIQVTLLNPYKKISPGDSIFLKASLQDPKTPSNPGEFNYKTYLARMGIRKTAFGIGSRSIWIIPQTRKPTWINQINLIRLSIKNKIDQIFHYPENSLAAALILGTRKNIPDDIRDMFAKTGTAHLLAISGLNITLVSGLFYLLLRYTHIFSRKINAFLALLLTILYIFIAGANSPVVRAGIMASVFLIGIILEHDGNFLNSLLLAFFLVIVLSPGSLLTPSFQLSFGAVFALSLFSIQDDNQIDKNSKKLLRNILFSIAKDFYSSLITFLALLPILIYYFNTLSHVVFITNLIASPLILFANVLILILLPIFYISEPISKILALLPITCLKLTTRSLDFFAHLPGGHFYIRTPSVWEIGSYYVGILLILFGRQSRFFKTLGAGFVAASCIGLSLSYLNPSIEITFLNIGKKNLIFFRTPQTNGLASLDGNLNDVTRWIAKPFLMASGVNQIDALWIKSSTQKIKWNQTLALHFKIKQTKYLENGQIFSIDKSLHMKTLGVDEQSHRRNDCVGFYLLTRTHTILFLNRLDFKQISLLSQREFSVADVLYISQISLYDETSAERLLKKINPRVLIINDRNNFREISTLAPPDTKIYKMSESGSLTLKEIDRKLTFSPFFNPENSRVAQD